MFPRRFNSGVHPKDLGKIAKASGIVPVLRGGLTIMIVTFKVMNGHLTGKEFRLPVPKCVIGRAPECYVRINSEAVSRRHCTVYLRDGWPYVRDMNSRNGTFVNGLPITNDCELKPGDRLRVGNMNFEVNLDPASPRTAKSSIVPKNSTGELLSADNLAPTESEITQYLGDAETRSLKIEDSRDATISGLPAPPPKKSEKEKLEMPPQSAASNGHTPQAKIPGSWSQKKRASNTETAAEEALKRILRGQ
jgi:pSer/pThr/pTyr-binding forkhead associated (FHA) protein